MKGKLGYFHRLFKKRTASTIRSNGTDLPFMSRRDSRFKLRLALVQLVDAGAFEGVVLQARQLPELAALVHFP